MKRLALVLVWFVMLPPVSAGAGARSADASRFHLMVRIPRTLAVGAACYPSIRLAGYQSRLGRLILQFNGLLRWARVDMANPGWNPGDADYTPQRVSVPGGGVALDFGRQAYEVVLAITPKKPGRQSFAIQPYLGDWYQGKPRVRQKLLGAAYTWSGYVRKLPRPGGTIAECQKWG